MNNFHVQALPADVSSAGYECKHLQMRETRNRFLRNENIIILTERGTFRSLKAMNEHPRDGDVEHPYTQKRRTF